MNKAYGLLISGKVQGVSYRKAAKSEALRLGLTGFVKNLSNGQVYVHAEGPEDALSKFMDWCHVGSRLALVTSVETEAARLTHSSYFEVKN